MIYPHAPRTDFSTVMHSRGSRVSPLLVWLEMGSHPQNKTAHTDWDQTFSPLRGCHFSSLDQGGHLGA